MGIVQDRVFENERIAVDGRVFYGCIFKNSVLVYSGGDLPRLNHCIFNGFRWEFEGAAKTTLELLRALYQAGDQHTISGVFDFIKTPSPEISEPASAFRN